jgi:energy-coupling factor transport system ATP-binding protein
MLDLARLTLVREAPDGPVPVVRDLTLRLARGERLALIGGNGSGKSSLLRHLAEPGVLPGVRVGLVTQDPDEQLVAATVAGELALGRPDVDAATELADLGLDALADVDPRLLSAGEKQRLQVGSVLARRPDLLLLDEPGSLQDHQQAAWLAARISAQDATVIWATQIRGEVLRCDRALLLDDGRVVAAGPAAEVAAAPAARWLWQTPAARAPGPASPETPPLALLEDVSCRFHRGGLAGISLQLRAGERLGLVGANGAGKSTLLGVLAGLRRPERGRVVVAGRSFYRRRGLDVGHGLVALAPQFPEYAFVSGRIDRETAISGLPAGAVLAAAGLPADLGARAPHDLSGGERRRLALALALQMGRPLVLLDEPTAALDARGRDAVLAQLAALPADTALVVASHDETFLRAAGCRVVEVAPDGLVAREA